MLPWRLQVPFTELLAESCIGDRNVSSCSREEIGVSKAKLQGQEHSRKQDRLEQRHVVGQSKNQNYEWDVLPESNPKGFCGFLIVMETMEGRIETTH